MPDNLGFDSFDYDDLLRWVPTWVMLEQAKLMLAHLSDSPTQWPDNAIYTHSVISALRSFTLFLQKEFKHDTGFDEWYTSVRTQLAADPEFAYLLQARNYVLHEGALMIHSRPGPDGTELRIRPARSQSNPRLADPPDRDLTQMLAEKIEMLERILNDAKERFPEADEWDWDPELEAEIERLTDETDWYQAVEQNAAEVMKRATIHFDGGGQSPGPVTAACTVALSDGSFDQDVTRFDQGTHNTAEWHALILGLRMALKHGERHVVVKGDSMLVVKQINREWKTKNAALQALRAQAEELLALFETWRVEWIPRKENRRTDELGRAQ